MNDNVAIKVERVFKTFNLKRPDGLIGSIKKIESPFTNSKIIALNNVTFDVYQGETFGIIGLNGSGKTTLLRMIAGIYVPDSGIIKINGKLAPLLQIGSGFHPELTGPENIIISGMLMGFSKSDIENKVEKIIQFAELEDYTNMKLKHYSSGMIARLAFSIGIQVDPDILLVDEVLAVGDISFREKSYKEFLKFKDKKKTIVYTTHILTDLHEVCDRVMLLDKGVIKEIGNPLDVIKVYREMISKNK